jgi:hypothetical protein
MFQSVSHFYYHLLTCQSSFPQLIHITSELSTPKVEHNILNSLQIVVSPPPQVGHIDSNLG